MADRTMKDVTHWTPRLPRSEEERTALQRHAKVFDLTYAAMLRACVAEILARHLGFDASAHAQKGVLGDGRPIPMMSYAFVEYVMGLDLSGFAVLELGGGNSSLFWADRVKSVLTLEHDQGWLEQVKEQIPANVELRLIGPAEYGRSLATMERQFDLIVIDCAANRFECAKALDGRLAAGGMVVLDNSEWYPNTAAELRAQGLIQVDFPDFRPDHAFRCCTSMFLHPDFRPKPRDSSLPLPVIGGKHLSQANKWDAPV